MDDNNPTEAVTDALSNIPGIGPARKAALYAAGIMTRAALAQASVEQLISLTGMPRAQAEKALEALQTAEASPLSDPSPQIAPPLMDEAMPDTPLPIPAGDPSPEQPVLPDDDPATETQGLLDNAAFRARTALSDATRVWSLPRLTKSMERLAKALDTMTEQADEALRPSEAKRLTARLMALAEWIEKSLAEEKPLSEKRRVRVRERLKLARVEIEKTVRASIQRSSKKRKRPTDGTSRVSKIPSKRIKKK